MRKRKVEKTCKGDSQQPEVEGTREEEHALEGPAPSASSTQGAGGEGEEKEARKELYNLKVVRANNRTYITAKQDLLGKNKLVVEITEKMSENHRDLIIAIAKAIEAQNLDKEGALALRKEFLSS